MSDMSLILTALGSIALLLFLVMKVRLHAVVSLILVSIIAGLFSGMNPADITNTIQQGMGGTLGFVAVVVALGAMFGRVMEETGALDQIAHTLLNKFGNDKAHWAMTFTGFICALPLFFDVAVVLLIGIAFAVVRKGGGSVVKIGISLLAGIATCQAFLIPAPGPILVASQLNADFGYMIVFGLLASIPAMILGGPLFASLISQKVHVELPAHEQQEKGEREGGPIPSFALSISIVIFPLLLIGLKTVVSRFIDEKSDLHNWLALIGHPFTAILLACLIAFYVLGVRRNIPNDRIMEICSSALQPAGVIILVTGAGGVFKQVLIDSGVGDALGNMLAGSGLPIVILAFILSASVRVIQGSATVAMLTACGLIIPILEPLNLDGAQLAAITIAIGGGSIVLSHVNDSGFWLANRFLGLSEKQTLQTWTVMETIIGTTGGIVAVIISAFL
ncbi:gluconate transporter [Shewanella baltica]|jgi:Gnt-I system low-affinity gluconate transporter|uniref:Gluconate transporter n=3 Tax=Shewanella TaxID=22 RepID=A9L669_SHEB9|nr:MULTISPECIES: gluconate transporter [Shewanella]ABX51334.1 gluconate transporter [Shewanella baltica OS195]ADT96336.1 gluconate transporter [Shewanella baltica OS678]AEG09616.1 gluconate transporter [Shewanella baltica BA175]EHC07172.1 gluconate transporter [Shewanella baltica OS625]EHQ16867.1 gluconate transporter [Shewanella baltica OS183]